MLKYFNPRSPWGERPNSYIWHLNQIWFQSTLSVRRATKQLKQKEYNQLISIHALREESDLAPLLLQFQCGLFQSTLSVRRATRYKPRFRKIHNKFQSTLSVRRATLTCQAFFQNFFISIHALREESDLQGTSPAHTHGDFNPRSPWGERPIVISYAVGTMAFQSTLSVRRATDIRLAPKPCCTYFNPRSPWGERRCKRFSLISVWTISIHALREESDCNGQRIFLFFLTFQSTLSVRRATYAKLN